MPIREACHVAVQRNHPSKQKLWKHAQARQQAKGKGPIPVLQIVCPCLTDLTYVDMDLCTYVRTYSVGAKSITLAFVMDS